MIQDSFLKSFRETKSPFITNPYRHVSGAVGGWVELGRTTLGSAADTISVASLADKRYLMILRNELHTGSSWGAGRFNSDSGSNYSDRFSTNGGADSTLTSRTQMIDFELPTSGTQGFTTKFVSNLSAQEKLCINQSIGQGTAGAGTAPDRRESVNKWANTSNPINEYSIHQQDSGDFASGSEMVVLGWDPADTHTSNFWEELASVNGDGTSAFDTGTFTAKKYLWIQAFIDKASVGLNTQFQVGNSTLDTGSNYSRRRNENGGSDETGTSEAYMNMATYSTKEFHNFFVINNSANEKLFICNSNLSSTAGAANAPNRLEGVYKWANTSNQINRVGVNSGNTVTLSSSSQIKVWGAN